MKSLEQMRDELADEYIGLRRAGKEAYLAGWDACAALYEEKLAVAVEALEFYANYMSGNDLEFIKGGWQKYPPPGIAREAMKKLLTTKEKE